MKINQGRFLSLFQLSQRGRVMSFALVTLVFFSLLIKLGFWQLGRAVEKEALWMQMSTSLQKPLQSLPLLTEINATNLSSLKGASISLSGQFLTNQSLLLDNQIYQSKVGYRWFVPLALAGYDFLILVDLGWLLAKSDRKVLPQLPKLDGSYFIQGTLDLPSKPFLLKKSPLLADFPKRVQSIDLALLAEFYQKPLYPFVLRAKQLKTDNRSILPWEFTPQWNPVVMKADKHYGYALQWFGLAIVLLIGFIIWGKKELL